MGALKAIPPTMALAFFWICACWPCRAAERVVLKNGFHLICNHQQAVGAKVRLYFDQGDENYVAVKAGEIASTAFVQEPSESTAEDGPEATASAAKKPSAADLSQLIAQAGAEHNIDVDLLASVVRAESGGNPQAVSPAGAVGLMQLMPKTAAEMGVQDRLRPTENVNGGTAYLDALLTRYHENLALALAAYNAGPAAVDRYHGIPPYPETRNYVIRVIRQFNRRKEAEMARRNSPVPRGPAPDR